MVKQGYKQTEIGVIPEDWEVVKIASVVDFDNGLAHEGIESEAGDFIVVNSKFISTEGKVIRKVTKQLKPLVKNDICIVMSDIPNGKALAKCYLIEKDNIYTLNQRIGRISSKNENPRFLFYELNRNKYYLSFDSGSGQTNLRKNEVLNCLIPLPPLTEQEAIATALSDADAWIENLEQLIAKKRLIKQGAMQTLLTPPSHAEPVEAWEVKKLGDMSVIYTGKKNNQDKIENGKYPFFVRSQTVERINSYSYDGEAILIPGEGNLGSIVHYINGKFDFHQRVYKISDFNGLHGKYLYFYFRMYFGAHAMQNTVKATVDSIRLPTLEEFVIKFPSLSEQERIATILSDMDAELEALERQLGKARQIKQGMMQELLTGRTRLV